MIATTVIVRAITSPVPSAVPVEHTVDVNMPDGKIARVTQVASVNMVWQRCVPPVRSMGAPVGSEHPAMLSGGGTGDGQDPASLREYLQVWFQELPELGGCA